MAGGVGGVLGVLMLDTRFERVVGDIGNPASFGYPVLHRVVPGASVRRVVGEQDDGLVDLFAAHAAELVAAGATAITTSCGFMARHQPALESRIPVPFAASPLCLLTAARARFGSVGVITADRSRLGAEHFVACGATPVTALGGMETRAAFRASILEETEPVRPELIEAEVCEAAAELQAEHPVVRALLLECTNLPPYRAALEARTGLPVIDALTLCDELMNSASAWQGQKNALRFAAAPAEAPGYGMRPQEPNL